MPYCKRILVVVGEGKERMPMLVVLLGIFMATSIFVCTAPYRGNMLLRRHIGHTASSGEGHFLLDLSRKRSKKFFSLSGMCICLVLEFCGILFFAVKKDGCPREMLEFLFMSMQLKTAIQHLSIPLNIIGYMTAIGRYLFPFFLLQIAMRYSVIFGIRRKSLIKKISAVLPAVSLVIYYPGIYKEITLHSPGIQDILAEFSYFWILLYISIALDLLIYEYFSIKIASFRRQFSFLVICMISFSGLYLLYCGQDPGQIYGFYDSSYQWKRGIGYLQDIWNIKVYYLLVFVNIVCGIAGFISLWYYTKKNCTNDMEEEVLEHKYGVARIGTLAFVHSIKNQLSANRAIFRGMDGMDIDKKEDIRKMQEYITVLEDINETMLERIETLYQSVKLNSFYMVSCRMEEVIAGALERFHSRFPDIPVEIVLGSNALVLVDKIRLCEVIYSLLVNAQDAVEAAKRGEEGKIALLSYEERLYTVIEIRDNGTGIPKATMKKIFEPFYTSKNKNHNWGMGLYYARVIVKGHLGSMRVESKEGRGSSFYIILPKYIS